MHDERIWPWTALRRRPSAVAAFSRGGAEGGRPGQRENVEIELTRIVLAHRLAARIRDEGTKAQARKGQTNN